ncbi:tetratricopeptide repeat protein [Compostibacter hankyongensis]|uniref:Tetratricopeptide repeat protein n=1 Tax=Compostibacter hankyongensis TaxID=1007089 RepID=A0ABP8FM38_9BACT
MQERIAQLQEFLAREPEDDFLRHALAMEYLGTGATDKARMLFEAVLKKNPAYVPSYYQLGKLLEQEGDAEAALAVFEKGMAAAKAAGEQRAYNELQSAYEELAY